MTATELLPPTSSQPSSRVRAEPVTQSRVIRSEWIKLRSLRSTVSVGALTVVLMIGIGLLVAYFTESRWATMGPADRASFDPIRRTLIGVDVAQLAAGVLGVLVITGEYTTGMIRATLGAVPRRLPVLWAKAAVFAVVTFVLSLVSTLVAFLGGQAILGSHGVSLGSPGALRAVFGVALYLTIVGMLGLALGFLIRTTAGGIVALVSLLLVIPGIVGALPSSWQATIVPYLPSQAGQALFTTHHEQYMMHPWPGFALFCGYAVVAMAAAAWSLRRRDA
jgi:ABC-2 type transport system permease protein